MISIYVFVCESHHIRNAGDTQTNVPQQDKVAATNDEMHKNVLWPK